PPVRTATQPHQVRWPCVFPSCVGVRPDTIGPSGPHLWSRGAAATVTRRRPGSGCRQGEGSVSKELSQHQPRSRSVHPHRVMVALAILATSVGGLVAAVGPTAAPASATVATSGNSSVPSPTVQGPILPTSGISFLGSTLFSLSKVGYEESEFFLSGMATAYTSKTALTKDGKWHVTPAGTAPYTTRVVVYRPVDSKKFDGTVDVEWLNVTGGIDAAAAWLT